MMRLPKPCFPAGSVYPVFNYHNEMKFINLFFIFKDIIYSTWTLKNFMDRILTEINTDYERTKFLEVCTDIQPLVNKPLWASSHI
jgi:hypothetical protein